MKIRNKNLLLTFAVASFVGAFFVKIWFYPSNLLLQKPLVAIFTEEDRFKRDWREGGFHASSDKRKLTIYFQEKFDGGRNHHFIVTYFKSLPEGLSEKHKNLFKHESRIIGDKVIDLYSYSTGKLNDPTQWLKIYDEILEMVLSEKASKLTVLLAMERDFSKTSKQQTPTKLSIEPFADLLKNKRFLFYTGSGLSIAAGIPTGMQLSRNEGHDKTKEVDQFVTNVLTNPQAIIDVHKKFEETFRHVKPTVAHKAIANLAMTYNAHVVTSNVDELHEQSGVKAWNIMYSHTQDSWFGEKATPESGNFAYFQENPQWLKDIDFVICVGMSADVKGFLGWYKKHNPNGKIIAVNKLSVPYLGDEDYFVQGDIQEIVPKVSMLLQTKTKRKTILDKTVSIPKMVQTIPHLPPLCDEINGLKKGFADVKGGKLYYEEEGQGIPVVLINGGPGGTHNVFHPYFSSIKDIARVIYYDQRGTGKSIRDDTGKTYIVKQAVEDLESLRRALNVDKWVVLGWSYGGLLAQCYALRYPDRCLGMVLGVSEITIYNATTDPGREKKFFSKEELAVFKHIDEEVRNGKIDLGVAFYNKQLAGDWKRMCYYKPTREELIRRMLYSWVPAPGFVEKMRSDMYTIKLQGKFDNFKIPTLIVEGKLELLWWDTPEDRIELWRKNHPKAQIELFEKSGHMIFADEPDKFFTLLRDFIEKSSQK